MGDELPKVTIGANEFFVDIGKMEFRDVKNRYNAISFHDVQDNDDHLLMLFDHQSKNAFQGTWEQLQERNDVVVVKLKPLKDLDPVGWNKLMGGHKSRQRLR